MKKSQKILIIVVVILVVIGAFYFLVKRTSEPTISLVTMGQYFTFKNNSTKPTPVALNNSQPLSLDEISTLGLQNFINKYNSVYGYENFMFDEVFPKIASGDDKWGEVGYQMYQQKVHGIGASIGETVGQPLSRALNKNPVKILLLFKNDPHSIFGVEKLCVKTDWEFDDSGSKHSAMNAITELNERKSAVEGVVDESLLRLKQKCLEATDSSLSLYSRELK